MNENYLCLELDGSLYILREQPFQPFQPVVKETAEDDHIKVVLKRCIFSFKVEYSSWLRS